jgi:uncharacterized integral membrane protein (TIGR00698 family)
MDAAIALPQPTAASRLLGLMPGVALSAGLAFAAIAIRRLPGLGHLSPAMIAILLGMVLRRIIGLRPNVKTGLGFTMRTLLRLAVVLLGLQVTFAQIIGMGLTPLLAVAAGLLVCFFGTVWLGARLGVDPKLARLIATGTSICGASAIVAANSVTRGKDEEVGYALAAITLLGIVAMLTEPAASLLLHMAPGRAGVWLGASLHDVAQVVAAASQLGDEATRNATIAKMVRILMLAPMVLGMAAYEHHRHKGQKNSDEPHAKIPMPWFVLGFLALAGLNSGGMIPVEVIRITGLTAGIMLAAAVGAMGFAMDLRALHRKGLRPLILAVASWLLIAGVSLGLTYLS